MGLFDPYYFLTSLFLYFLNNYLLLYVAQEYLPTENKEKKPIANKIIEIDKVKRETQTVLQNLLAERNQISKTIGQLKSQCNGNQTENIIS